MRTDGQVNSLITVTLTILMTNPTSGNTARCGIICIRKAGDRGLKNYRPITRLTTIYKLRAATMEKK